MGPGLSRADPYHLCKRYTAPSQRSDLRRQLEEASLGGANARQLQRLDLSLALVKWLAMQAEAASAPRPRG